MSKDRRYTREGLPIVTEEVCLAFSSEASRNSSLEGSDVQFERWWGI